MTNSKINIMIAGMFSHPGLQLYFLKNRKYREYFNITLYDGVNNCKWNGGRINRDDCKWDENIYNYYKKLGINCALTFSNRYIDLNDTQGLNLLDLTDNSNNYIIVNNNKLNKFIKENYKHKTIKSITSLNSFPSELTEEYLNKYKQFEKDYDLIVPRIEHIFDKNWLNSINPLKYEIMLNNKCVPNCPYLNSHYKQVDLENQAGNTLSKNNYKRSSCWLMESVFDETYQIHSKNTFGVQSQNLELNIKDIKKLIDLGFRSFKLTGREHPTEELIDTIDKYFTFIYKNTKE